MDYIPFANVIALRVVGESLSPFGTRKPCTSSRERTAVTIITGSASLEKQAVTSVKVVEPTSVEAKSIALYIDGGHVRSVRQYQVRSFEVLPAQVTNDDGKQIVFNSVPAEAISRQDQLRGVLHKLGATAVTPVTILSDGRKVRMRSAKRPVRARLVMYLTGSIF
jgi:hypothetical protein